jgi:hypothetical protein
MPQNVILSRKQKIKISPEFQESSRTTYARMPDMWKISAFK